MRLIKASYKILTDLKKEEILKSIEAAGRTAYKSEDKITQDSSAKFVATLIKRGHLSVIEHESFSVRFIVDRGVSHEIVRHRLASFIQESTRYCNYSKAKFNKELTFIIPEWLLEFSRGHVKIEDNMVFNTSKDITSFSKMKPDVIAYLSSLQEAEAWYFELLSLGWIPQQARAVLPNSLKTEMVVTTNLREWRHIFKLRTAKAAHPQIREVMCPLLDEIKEKIPIIFDDINYE